jgi:hypothetical protein
LDVLRCSDRQTAHQGLVKGILGSERSESFSKPSENTGADVGIYITLIARAAQCIVASIHTCRSACCSSFECAIPNASCTTWLGKAPSLRNASASDTTPDERKTLAVGLSGHATSSRYLVFECTLGLRGNRAKKWTPVHPAVLSLLIALGDRLGEFASERALFSCDAQNRTASSRTAIVVAHVALCFGSSGSV